MATRLTWLGAGMLLGMALVDVQWIAGGSAPNWWTVGTLALCAAAMMVNDLRINAK